MSGCSNIYNNCKCPICLSMHVNCLKERLDQHEEMFASQLNRNSCAAEIDEILRDKISQLERDIKVLGKTISALMEKIPKEIGEILKIKGNQPYKCPACDGEGFRIETKILAEHECVACQGKGILWN